MLLVAGGQLDPNIGALLRQCLTRRVAFCDLLVGPDLSPDLRLDMTGRLTLNGEEVKASACFLRHDVFLAERTSKVVDHRAALNWYHAVRDWALADPAIRIPNRHGRSTEQGKYMALRMARERGLRIPDTMIASARGSDKMLDHVRKPVAGGELTEAIDFTTTHWEYPYFVQPRLRRPELRVYRIGAHFLGFTILSDDLDYREHHRVTIAAETVPADLMLGLGALCDDLGLDFAAADFMLDAADRWTFLEVNSQPMFAAFDALIDGQLSDHLIDWLIPVNGKRCALSLEEMATT